MRNLFINPNGKLVKAVHRIIGDDCRNTEWIMSTFIVGIGGFIHKSIGRPEYDNNVIVFLD